MFFWDSVNKQERQEKIEVNSKLSHSSWCCWYGKINLLLSGNTITLCKPSLKLYSFYPWKSVNMAQLLRRDQWSRYLVCPGSSNQWARQPSQVLTLSSGLSPPCMTTQNVIKAENADKSLSHLPQYHYRFERSIHMEPNLDSMQPCKPWVLNHLSSQRLGGMGKKWCLGLKKHSAAGSLPMSSSWTQKFWLASMQGQGDYLP